MEIVQKGEVSGEDPLSTTYNETTTFHTFNVSIHCATTRQQLEMDGNRLIQNVMLRDTESRIFQGASHWIHYHPMKVMKTQTYPQVMNQARKVTDA